MHAPGSARLVHYGAERIVATADVTRPSLLVLTDTYYPGWSATVDGKAVPVDRVDYMLRGVPVPAGRHRVEFRYAPVSWTAGRIISASTLLGLLLVAAAGWRRRRATPSSISGSPRQRFVTR